MSNAVVAEAPAAVEATPRQAKDYRAMLDFDALRWHVQVAAKNDYQAIFRGVALFPNGDMVSSDGFHLAVSTGAVDWENDAPDKAIVISDLPRNLPLTPQKHRRNGTRAGQSIAVLEAGVITTVDNKLHAVGYLDGTFPDYQRVLPAMTPENRKAMNFTGIDIADTAAAIARMPMPATESHPKLEYYGRMAVLQVETHLYCRAVLNVLGDDYRTVSPGEVFKPNGWKPEPPHPEAVKNRMTRGLKLLNALVREKEEAAGTPEHKRVENYHDIDVLLGRYNNGELHLITEHQLRLFEELLMDALTAD